MTRFADSIFPGSSERALQIIDDPRKGPPRGLFTAKLILIPPEEISHITLRKGEQETTATVKEMLGETSDPDIQLALLAAGLSGGRALRKSKRLRPADAG